SAQDFGTCGALSDAVWCWTRFDDRRASYYLSTMTTEVKVLVFGALSDGSVFTTQSGPQTVRISQVDGGARPWSATTDQPWLSVSPSNGSGSGTVTVTVRLTPGLAATQRGHVHFRFDGAATIAATVDLILNIRPGPG